MAENIQVLVVVLLWIVIARWMPHKDPWAVIEMMLYSVIAVGLLGGVIRVVVMKRRGPSR